MTEKKVREHLKRIWFHLDRLQSALNSAHHEEVIQYTGDYIEVAPCATMSELRDRIRLTTKDALARAVEEEIRKKHPKW